MSYGVDAMRALARTLRVRQAPFLSPLLDACNLDRAEEVCDYREGRGELGADSHGGHGTARACSMRMLGTTRVDATDRGRGLDMGLDGRETVRRAWPG